ncbi:hypothetical protein LC082_13920 [Microbacterium esteraromaticum]|uniref:hypothetical protein n=1 Tax=Microbacterium esteraromaticum TaxID=57043 RepID=UPI001CD5810C|nr:hypothetical protein [Microbacterium esteraromaticum]MCA1307995.1 hypothetical protein [Microbacterium esteraromaticum]
MASGQSETTEDSFADELDEQSLADYAASLQSSAEVRFDGSESGADVYWLHRAYQDAPHDEALEKTDALYQAIEDTNCLVLEGPESKIRPEMVPGWNH